MKAAQSKLKEFENPAFDIAEIEIRKQKVLDLFNHLMSKPKPLKEKKSGASDKAADVEMKDANEEPSQNNEDAKMADDLD